MKRISDSQQRLMVAAAFVLEFYKVMMGSMLTVFVPQRCGAGDDDVCSLGQIASQLLYADREWTQRAALLANAATMVVVVVLYGFEAYREDWCISNLDIDPHRPATQLDAELAGYPDLRQAGALLNARYSRMSGVAAAVVTANFAMSGVYLLQHQAGLSTLVSLLSYLLLLAVKLHQSYRISHASLKEGRAYSAYMSTQRTFNCVDEDVVAQRQAAQLEMALAGCGEGGGSEGLRV